LKQRFLFFCTGRGLASAAQAESVDAALVLSQEASFVSDVAQSVARGSITDTQLDTTAAALGAEDAFVEADVLSEGLSEGFSNGLATMEVLTPDSILARSSSSL
jgi:hypothetical protein